MKKLQCANDSFLLVPTEFWEMEFSLSSILYLCSKATYLDLKTLSFQLVDVHQFMLCSFVCCPCTSRSEKVQELPFLFQENSPGYY